MKDALISYPVNCDGVLPKKDDTLIAQRSEASVTVFKDGRREVGCSYIDEGKCTLLETLISGRSPNCAHLFPESSKPMLGNHSMVGVLREMKSSVTSKEGWPYNFKKTRHQEELESRFSGSRVDDLVREAISQTSSLNEAAHLLGITYDEIFNWKSQFNIELPRRHRTHTS